MLVERIKRFFLEYTQPRFSEWKGWYASRLLDDARDQYWSRLGEKETDPSDLVGKVKMFLGKAIETGISDEILANLHWYGIHPYGGKEQIPVGFTDKVSVSGKLDGLIVERRGDTFGKPWVLEIKVKTGYGADCFNRDCDPGEEYLAQMGSYLKKTSEKGFTDRGMFLFPLVSDQNIGQIWEVHCRYADGEVIAYHAVSIHGETKDIDYRLKMDKVLDRLVKIEQCVATKTLPEVDNVYKHPITDEMLASLSDSALRKLVDGVRVEGDWKIKYSRYKTKHLELQGGPGYTDAENEKIQAEYLRRFPKGKKVAGGRK